MHLRCICPEGTNPPYCKQLNAHFGPIPLRENKEGNDQRHRGDRDGNSWVWLGTARLWPPVHISLQFRTTKPSGTLLYAGPRPKLTANAAPDSHWRAYRSTVSKKHRPRQRRKRNYVADIRNLVKGKNAEGDNTEERYGERLRTETEESLLQWMENRMTQGNMPQDSWFIRSKRKAEAEEYDRKTRLNKETFSPNENKGTLGGLETMNMIEEERQQFNVVGVSTVFVVYFSGKKFMQLSRILEHFPRVLYRRMFSA